jgi:glucosyl-3-phosphoglycerate synthase
VSGTGAVLAFPVLDEAANLEVVAGLAAECLARGIVGRALVLDGGSTDGSVARARELGLEVVEAERLAPTGPVRGKGDGVWRLIGALDAADTLVLIDGDVVGLTAVSVEALLAPLATDPGVVLVKGVCRRTVGDDGAGAADGAGWRAGRVSGLVARPLLAALTPELGPLTDPLSGQVAVSLDAVRRLPLASGYGLELAMVLAVGDAHGPDAVTEVLLEPIRHRQKDVDELAPVARDVVAVALARLGVVHPDPDAPVLLAAQQPGPAPGPGPDPQEGAAR